MDIIQKVKNTMLLDNKLKQKILSFGDKLPKKLEDFLLKFFKKYGEKEKEIVEFVLNNIGNVYMKSIQESEKKQKKEEEKDLKQLEEILGI